MGLIEPEGIREEMRMLIKTWERFMGRHKENVVET